MYGGTVTQRLNLANVRNANLHHFSVGYSEVLVAHLGLDGGVGLNVGPSAQQCPSDRAARSSVNTW